MCIIKLCKCQPSKNIFLVLMNYFGVCSHLKLHDFFSFTEITSLGIFLYITVNKFANSTKLKSAQGILKRWNETDSKIYFHKVFFLIKWPIPYVSNSLINNYRVWKFCSNRIVLWFLAILFQQGIAIFCFNFGKRSKIYVKM